jgi:hypothetical protein
VTSQFVNFLHARTFLKTHSVSTDSNTADLGSVVAEAIAAVSEKSSHQNGALVGKAEHGQQSGAFASISIDAVIRAGEDLVAEEQAKGDKKANDADGAAQKAKDEFAEGQDDEVEVESKLEEDDVQASDDAVDAAVLQSLPAVQSQANPSLNKTHLAQIPKTEKQAQAVTTDNDKSEVAASTPKQLVTLLTSAWTDFRGSVGHAQDVAQGSMADDIINRRDAEGNAEQDGEQDSENEVSLIQTNFKGASDDDDSEEETMAESDDNESEGEDTDGDSDIDESDQSDEDADSEAGEGEEN